MIGSPVEVWEAATHGQEQKIQANQQRRSEPTSTEELPPTAWAPATNYPRAARWPQTGAPPLSNNVTVPCRWSLCSDSVLTEWEGPLPFPATSAALPSVHSAHQWNLQLQMLQDHTDHSAWTPSASPDISIDGPNLCVQSCIDYLLLPGDPSICDSTCA